MAGTDAKRCYLARQETSSEDVWDEISVFHSELTNRPKTHSQPAFVGCWFSREKWIDEEPETVAGWTDVNGVQCVEVIQHGDAAAQQLTTHLYLDPGHDWLARKLWRCGEDTTIGQVTVIDEFQLLSNGRSFPKAGRTWHLDEPGKYDAEWLVTVVELNSYLPPSKMGPPASR